MTWRNPKFQREFRSDINGLRAIAVAVVVLFHLDVPYLDGGFVGVDVFFVISGFLMATIVYRGLLQNSMGIWAFYFARFRRIYPALAVMLISVGLFLTLAADPVTSATNNAYAVSAALFYSNIIFAFQNGYFAASSESNWLLHTWSLSVEWQFYVVFPVVATAIYKIAPSLKTAFVAMLVVAALSLGLTIVLSQLSTTFVHQNFFQFPARSWELLLGGMIALIGHELPRKLKAPLTYFGIGLILIAVLTLNSESLWPSAWTLVPVLGTALVLLGNHQRGVWHQNAVVAYLGSRSYSLYLWHWPVVVALGYFGFETRENPMFVAIGLLVSVVLAELSYRFVELRAGGVLDRAAVVAKPVVAAAVIGLVVVVGSQLETLGRASAVPLSLSTSTRAAATDFLNASQDWLGFRACPEANYTAPRWQNVSICRFTGAGDLRVAVVGDSLAEQFVPRFTQRADFGVLDFLYAPGCPPFAEMDRNAAMYRCTKSTAQIQAALLEGSYDRVVVIAAIEEYFDASRNGNTCIGAPCMRLHKASEPQVSAFVETAAAFWGKLHETGSDVALLGALPISEHSALDHYIDTISHNAPAHIEAPSTPDMAARFGPVNALAQKIASQAGIGFIDPLDHMCDTHCPLKTDGSFLFKDNNHFRSSLVGGAIFDWVDDVLFGTGTDAANS